MRTATFTSNEGDRFMKLSAALRNDGTGWEVIDGPAHEPLGISIGKITSTYIEVTFPECVEVCDFVCGPDERLALPPYSATFGASVGLARAVIQGTVNGALFNPLTWANASANIWLSGWMLLHPDPRLLV